MLAFSMFDLSSLLPHLQHPYFLTAISFNKSNYSSLTCFEYICFSLRNINLQNLKRASAFIDIMDRHLDKVCILLLSQLSQYNPGGPGLPQLLQGRVGQGQDDLQQGDLQEVLAGI